MQRGDDKGQLRKGQRTSSVEAPKAPKKRVSADWDVRFALKAKCSVLITCSFFQCYN
jgi:hypothetical protein